MPSPRRGTLVLADRPQFLPLFRGEIPLDGFRLVCDPRNGIATRVHDADVAAGEISIARHVRDLAAGTSRWTALPVYPSRGFVERSFWVAAASRLTSLGDLAGHTVGIASPLSTHSVWVRISLGRAGIPAGSISWTSDESPAWGADAKAGTSSLADGLQSGAIDCAVIPDLHGEAPTGLRRLVPDYVAAEADGMRDGGLYPAYHVVGIRTSLLERDPMRALRLVAALRASGRSWAASQATSHAQLKATPWFEHELERSIRILGRQWRDGGLWAPSRVVDAVAGQLRRDGAVTRAIRAREVFSTFRSLGGTISR